MAYDPRNPYGQIGNLLDVAMQRQQQTMGGVPQGVVTGALGAIQPFMGYTRAPVSMGQMLAAAGSGAQQGMDRSLQQQISLADVQAKIGQAKLAQEQAALERTSMDAYAQALGLPPGTPKEVVMEVLKSKGSASAPTATQKDYQTAVSQGYEGSLFDYQRDLAEARATGGAGGLSLTPAQRAVDAKFAPGYVEWNLEGGRADTMKGLEQLRGAVKKLEDKSLNMTGFSVGAQPDAVLAVTNPEALRVKQDVEEVVQRNLRLILGPQFTQAEGERLIARAYNPMLEEGENVTSVKRLIRSIEKASAAKDSAARYYEKNGTLAGYSGEIPSLSSIESEAFGSVENAAPEGVPADVWAEMTEEERAAWQ